MMNIMTNFKLMALTQQSTSPISQHSGRNQNALSKPLAFQGGDSTTFKLETPVQTFVYQTLQTKPEGVSNKTLINLLTEAKLSTKAAISTIIRNIKQALLEHKMTEKITTQTGADHNEITYKLETINRTSPV